MLFLFLQVLRCFNSLRSLRTPMDSALRFPAHRREGFPIRRSPDQGPFAAPRGLSQLDASFFASWRLVILDALLVA